MIRSACIVAALNIDAINNVGPFFVMSYFDATNVINVTMVIDDE
jgi:hypothetical protein